MEEATRTRSRGLVIKPDTRIPAVTILWHSSGRRVGERALLAGLAFGDGAQVSRDAPLFGAPDAEPLQPLAEPSVSRSAPLQMRRVEGAILFRCARAGKVWIDGQPLEQELRVPESLLEAGVVIRLSYGVALVLHLLSGKPRPPEIRGMIGESEAVRRARQQIANVAGHPASVLVLGESGTGKELAARAIHDQSPRNKGPFVAVSMASIPPNLAASALFGQLAGAFTGAHRDQPGYFGQAKGGTLFLDEIGQAPLEIQAALLRAIEAREIQPVGAAGPRAVDVRVVAATDADLQRAVSEGRFLEPLLHRFRSYELQLAPLRERREDVGRILRHFLQEELTASGRAGLLECAPEGEPWLPASLVAQLALGELPGNVRALRNAAQRLVIDWSKAAQVEWESWPGRSMPARASGVAAAVVGVPPVEASAFKGAAAREPTPGELSGAELVAALEQSKWSVDRAAQALEISRTTLYKLMRQHGLSIAGDLTPEQIRPRLVEHQGHVGRAAQALQVSEKALRDRLRALDDRSLNELLSPLDG